MNKWENTVYDEMGVFPSHALYQVSYTMVSYEAPIHLAHDTKACPPLLTLTTFRAVVQATAAAMVQV